MKQLHPFRRSLPAAAAVMLVMTIFGTLNWTGVFRSPTPEGLTLLGGMAAGAFLVALPGRIRHRREMHGRPGLRGCAFAFAGGAVLMLGVRLAGMDDTMALAGAMQGSLSALAFAATAWLAAFAAARLAGRRVQ